MFPYDQANETHQRELDAAFKAGAEHATAEFIRTGQTAAAVDLAARVKVGVQVDAAYRQGFETALFYACLFACVLVFWWLVGGHIVAPLVRWL